MGWLYGWESRKELIAHVTRREDNEHAIFETLRKYASGNDLWTVQQRTVKATGQVDKYIQLYKLSRSGGQWGYKDIDESMGPLEHSCPLVFLELAPDPWGEKGRPEGYHDWRAGVRQYHKRRNQKLIVGQTVKLTNGKEYRVTRITRKVFGVELETGNYYQIPRRMLTLPDTKVLTGTFSGTDDNAGCDKCGMHDRISGSKFCKECDQEEREEETQTA